MEWKVSINYSRIRGVGEAAVKLCVKEGVDIVIIGIKDHEGKRVAAELRAEFIDYDVTRSGDMKNVMGTAVSRNNLKITSGGNNVFC